MNQGERDQLYRRMLRVVSAAVRNTVSRGPAFSDLDELLGEVWLHLVEKRVLDRVDPVRGSAEQLVYVAARNYTLTLLRRRRRLARHLVMVDKLKDEITADGPAPGPDAALVALARQDLEKALDHFDEDEREALVLSLVHDLTAAEILEVWQEKVTVAALATMQKRLQRLKTRLGEILSELVSTPPRAERKGAKESSDEGS